MKDNNIIHVENVSFRYKTETVLESVCLDVAQGEFLGLIGPNGSGKTTLLKVILGVLPPTSGSVSLFGTLVETFRDWSNIGYVPQKSGSSGMTFPITVEEMVALGRVANKRLLETNTHEDKEYIADALRAVDMWKHRNTLVSELSGGQQQRVYIAKALSSQPKLLILDEPTVGVDIESQVKFYQLLRELQEKRNLTLVMVSHDIDVVAHEVSKVACINKTLMYEGEPKEMLKQNVLEKLYGKDLRFILHGH